MAPTLAIAREFTAESELINSNYEHVEMTEDDTIPVIDFSLLFSSNPKERSKAIMDLDRACEEWGFFLLINHGIPENLRNSMLEYVEKIFKLLEEEMRKFQGKNVMDPVRCGIRRLNNGPGRSISRGYIKLIVHPVFHFPDKPAGYRDTAFEYCKIVREITGELLKGLSEGLGLELNYISEAMDLDSSFQRFVSQRYMPCPKPELASGSPAHSDHGLLTIVTDNGIPGLQTFHNGKWINLRPPPNAVMVNTCDQLEILTNGNYKSNVHRVFQIGNTSRISLVSTNGPSLDKLVSLAPELVDEIHPPAFAALTMREYYELHQSNSLDGKTILDQVRILNKNTP